MSEYYLILLVFMIVVLVIYSFYLLDNISKEKHKVITLNKEIQLLEMKGDLSKLMHGFKISYSTANAGTGKTSKETKVNIAPIESLTFVTLLEGVKVTVIDMAYVNSVAWYYVVFTSPDSVNNTNNKGWLHAEDVLLDAPLTSVDSADQVLKSSIPGSSNTSSGETPNYDEEFDVMEDPFADD